MNIALMTDDKKQELMTQFCIAYCGILAKHTLCATNTTGNIIKEATGLDISLFLSHEHGGCQQIGTRISYNEIDMVLFFTTSAASATRTTSPSPPTWARRKCSSRVWHGVTWIGEISSIPETHSSCCNPSGKA